MKPLAGDPPRLAIRLLERFAPPGWLETFAGDLEEEYRARVRRGRSARFWFWRQTVRALAARRPSDESGRRHTMASVLSDLRHGCRYLGRQKRYALVVTLALGLSLGAAAATLGVVRAYLWNPLPFPDADRIAAIDLEVADVPTPDGLFGLDWSAASDVAELIVAWDIDGFTIVGEDRPEAVNGRWIRADVFPMFGVVPVIGRTFTAEEAARAEPLAVIGHELWQTRFGGSPDAIGRTITVRSTDRPDETEAFTIVGVLPPRFWHLSDRTQVLVPLRGPRAPSLIRLRPGVSPEAAAARLTALANQNLPGVDPRWHITVIPAHERHVAPVRAMLGTIAVSVGLLALVACGNIAFLQLAHGLARRREMAVRLAIGASRARLLRQIAAEQLLLAAGATAVAVAMASWLTRAALPAVERYLGRVVPELGGAAPDATIVVATAGVAGAACLLSGLLPMMVTGVRRLAPLFAGGPSGTTPRARSRARQAIVGVQVAATFALMVGAALMVKSAWHLGSVDLGFETANVLSANLTLHQRSYPDAASRRAVIERIVDGLERQPQIEAAGLIGFWPFAWMPGEPVTTDGLEPGGSRPVAVQYAVNGSYFRALRIPLIEGRTFVAADDTAPFTPAVISVSLANRLWPGRSAVGRELRFEPEDPAGMHAGQQATMRVIGVVGDVSRSLVEERVPEVYVPLGRSPGLFLFLHARATTGAIEVLPVVEQVVTAEDPNLPLVQAQPFDAVVAAEGVRPRFLATVLGAFAALTAVIALVGVYAVSAWIARQRLREAALRIALGATSADVIRLLVGRGGLVVAGGLAAGWVASIALARLLADDLHGVTPADLATRTMAALALAGLCVSSLWLPARRASNVDPARILRED